MEIINIEDLSFKYNLGNHNVLENINLSINEGDFVVICGNSGCGKSTLLRHLKKEIAPYGEVSGVIKYKNTPLSKMDLRESATSIGFVMQNPDNQIVTDKVWHELAFGLENIGEEPKIIRRRVAEMANFFGIHTLFREDSDILSGGQKQILNLAATMLLQPDILVLDEPTSQLDPITATDFIETLKKINEEFGTTIILVEHRLEEIFKVANRVVVMENGKILEHGTPSNIATKIKKIDVNHNFFMSLPTPMRVALKLDLGDDIPITIKDGKHYLKKYFYDAKNTYFDCIETCEENDVIIELKHVYFRYSKEDIDILKGVNLEVNKGELYCLLGGNGSGKSTTINTIAGIYKPYRGKVLVNGVDINRKNNELKTNFMAYLPQNPTLLFSKDSVKEELEDEIKSLEIEDSNVSNELLYLINRFDIGELLNQHPYDLSGGEQQKVALIKILLRKPEIILLDEPTKGLDAASKLNLAKMLKELTSNKITILVVSHDIEFCAEHGSKCALFFDGDVISQDKPRLFFKDNNFYTTAASKLSRNIFENTILCQDVIDICLENI